MDAEDYVERLLRCAKFYHNSKPIDINQVPERFDDEESVFNKFRDIMLLDAHNSLQNAIEQPQALFLNAVDLDTNEPGLVTRDADTVFRGSSDVAAVDYSRRTHVDADVPRVNSRKKIAASRADKLIQSGRKRADTKRARMEEQAAYELMSPEEKAVVRTEKKAAREARRAERKVKVNADEGTEEDVEAEEPSPAEARNVHDTHEAEPARCKRVAMEEKVEAVTTDAQPKIKKVRKRGDATSYFESPASHDRHLQALTFVGLHKDIRDGILSGAHCESIRIVDGPPGTGKTTTMLNLLHEWLSVHPHERALVCSPTNIGVADLFTRALVKGIPGALALSKEHMPPETPRLRAGELAEHQVVFSTVAGRCAPRLCNQEFSAVFLDEAAHVIEAHTIGLLRPSVRSLIMVGDIAQLPAVVTQGVAALKGGRSLMERLLSLDAPSTALNVQHRMHPEILMFPNRFYAGRLTTAPQRASLSEKHSPYQMIHIQGTETMVGTSFENEKEAEAVIKVAESLRNEGMEVVVLVPYQAQARRLLAARTSLSVSTVDAYQGKECDAVVLSITRSSVGGFWDDPRRVCVALTRAKHVLRICINAQAFEEGMGLIGDLVADARARGRLA